MSSAKAIPEEDEAALVIPIAPHVVCKKCQTPYVRCGVIALCTKCDIGWLEYAMGLERKRKMRAKK